MYVYGEVYFQSRKGNLVDTDHAESAAHQAPGPRRNAALASTSST